MRRSTSTSFRKPLPNTKNCLYGQTNDPNRLFTICVLFRGLEKMGIYTEIWVTRVHASYLSSTTTPCVTSGSVFIANKSHWDGDKNVKRKNVVCHKQFSEERMTLKLLPKKSQHGSIVKFYCIETIQKFYTLTLLADKHRGNKEELQLKNIVKLTRQQLWWLGIYLFRNRTLQKQKLWSL